MKQNDEKGSKNDEKTQKGWSIKKKTISGFFVVAYGKLTKRRRIMKKGSMIEKKVPTNEKSRK
jgi:hypothetical protein